jgi:predicted Zn finger-like uncharacterized protein
MSLITTCPSCKTIYSLTHEQLDASSGQVRCGHCMQVFDANAFLDTAQEDSTLADNSQSETNSELSPHLSFIMQAQKQAFWNTSKAQSLLALLIGILTLLLGIQAFSKDGERIAKSFPWLSGISQLTCNVFSCQPAAKRQLDAWVIDHSSFQKDASGAFKLIVVLKNTIGTTLLIPDLELSLLDHNDALLVRRVVGIQSLGLQNTSNAQDQNLDLLITLSNQTQPVSGYRLVLFYP